MSINSDVLSIDLSLLKDSTSTRLRNIFKENRIISVNEVTDITEKELIDMGKVGVKTQNDFKNLIHNIHFNPEALITESKKYSPRVIPKVMTDDFLQNINNLLRAYYGMMSNKKIEDIMCKRYGLFGNKTYSLDDIGTFYEISRQRIMQVEDNEIKKINDLFKGHVIKRLFIIISPALQSQIDKLMSALMSYDYISEESVIDLISSETGNPVKSDPVLNLVMRMYGFKKSSIHNISYFYRKEKFSTSDFSELSRIVVKFLKKSVKPISLFDIVLKINKGNKTFSTENFTRIVEILPFIEEVDSTQKLYQISFHMLSSYTDMAFRILNEHGKELHLSEILRKIQQKSAIAGIVATATTKSISGQMVNDDRLMPIGRTGKWALSDWEINKNTIIELIINAFHINNKPCSAKDLIRSISEFRNDIDYHSVSSIISQNPDKVLRVKTGLYILREWEASYQVAS